jgi:hypothetical protein
MGADFRLSAQHIDFIRRSQGNKQGKNSLTHDFKAKIERANLGHSSLYL